MLRAEIKLLLLAFSTSCLLSCSKHFEIAQVEEYSEDLSPLSKQEREELCLKFSGLIMEESTIEDLDQEHTQNETGGLVAIGNPLDKKLLLGKRSGQFAELCVKPVVIETPRTACKAHRCDVHAFCYPPEMIYRDQRALLVWPCNQIEGQNQGDLLTQGKKHGWGSIQYFQPYELGSDLIKQRENDGEYFLEFSTEASEGYLYWRNGEYGWNESMP